VFNFMFRPLQPRRQSLPVVILGPLRTWLESQYFRWLPIPCLQNNCSVGCTLSGWSERENGNMWHKNAISSAIQMEPVFIGLVQGRTELQPLTFHHGIRGGVACCRGMCTGEYCSAYSRCYATTARWADIRELFLNNGSVHTSSFLDSRFLIMQQLEYNNGRYLFSTRSVPRGGLELSQSLVQAGSNTSTVAMRVVTQRKGNPMPGCTTGPPCS
jgi:hypothetical protein